MRNGDLSTQPKSEADTVHAVQFLRHLAEVKAHLDGKFDEDLPPSCIPPTGYWTSREKEAFFHGLTVYSRFRPDLIADDIGSKTAVDVCTYIDLLDATLSRRPRSFSRAELEGAMEVSDAWIQLEERASEALVALEAKYTDDFACEEHEGDPCIEQGIAQPCAVPEQFSATVKEAQGSRSECDKRRRQAYLLQRLGSEHLKVLEAILNQTDSGNVDMSVSPPPEDQVQSLSSQVHPASSTIMVDSVVYPTPPRAPGAPESSRDIFSQQETHSGSLVTEPPSLDDMCATPPDIAVPDRQQALSHALENSQGTSLSLSPTSRRRLQKRLYMRRKRASRVGQTAITAAGKLRPGRKAKEGQKTSGPKEQENRGGSIEADSDAEGTPGPSEDNTRSSPSLDQSQGSGDNDQSQQRRKADKHSKGGLTKFYRIKKDFTLNGINADTLVDGQLDLFHHAALSRFMLLFKSGYDQDTTETVSSISAGTIRLMATITTDFATEVIRRTIILREQERRMKDNIKTYGVNPDEVAVETINHVLDLMGMKELTKAQYLARLLADDLTESGNENSDDSGCNLADSDPETEAEGTGEEDRDNHSDPPCEDEPVSFPALLPLDHELHPPLIHLPASLVPHDLVSNGVGLSMEDLMSFDGDHDADALEQELHKEMELDKADEVLARQYEAELWKQVG